MPIARSERHQMPAVAEQRSPERVATATNLPPAPAIVRLTENEPLGPRVMADFDATSAPLRRSVTFHGTPLRFWSTSNSTSMPRSSFLSLSLEVEFWLQTPRTLTPSPPLAEAIGATVSAAPL